MVQSFPYLPGEQPKRREYDLDKYNPYQEALWQAINTSYFSWVEGRMSCYWPTPGFTFDMDKFRTWRQKFIKSSREESNLRGLKITRGIEEDDFSENLWMWLYERVLRAAELKPVNLAVF